MSLKCRDRLNYIFFDSTANMEAFDRRGRGGFCFVIRTPGYPNTGATNVLAEASTAKLPNLTMRLLASVAQASIAFDDKAVRVSSITSRARNSSETTFFCIPAGFFFHSFSQSSREGTVTSARLE